jgi:hypothetical protein
LLKNTGDEIAGATGSDVTLRAGRKLGGRAEALTPHWLDNAFIRFGGRQRSSRALRHPAAMGAAMAVANAKATSGFWMSE